MTSTSAKTRTLPTLWLAGALVFFVAEAIAAAAVTPPFRYSYVSDYISQLCVPGWTRLAAVMNAGLCVQGVTFFIGAVLAARMSASGRHPIFVILAALYGLGVVLVGAVPIGPDAPAINLTVFHRLGATLAIFGGNATVIAGASVIAGLVGVRWYRWMSVGLGILGFLSFWILTQPAAQPTLGIWERGCVYSVMVWQIFSAVVLFARPRVARPSDVVGRR